MRTKGTLSRGPKCRLLITSLHGGRIMAAILGCSHRIKGVKVYGIPKTRLNTRISRDQAL